MVNNDTDNNWWELLTLQIRLIQRALYEVLLNTHNDICTCLQQV